MSDEHNLFPSLETLARAEDKFQYLQESVDRADRLRLYNYVSRVERYAASLAQHIARSGDGPDSYAYAAIEEIHQGLVAALADQEPQFGAVAFVGQHSRAQHHRAFRPSEDEGANRAYDLGPGGGVIARTQEGEGSDV